MGGISSFRFCEYAQMPDFIKPLSNILTKEIAITGSWSIGKSDQNLKLSIDSDNDEQGTPYNIELQGTRGVSKELISLFASLMQKRFVVQATDSDYISYLLGNNQEHLAFSYSIHTSTVDGAKIAAYKFYGTVNSQPPLISIPKSSSGSASLSTSEPVEN